MRHDPSFRHVIAWTLIGTLAATGAACSSSGGGSGGTGGTGGSGAGASSSSTAGTGGTGGMAGGCHGDQTMWGMLTQGPVSCTVNSDCCVVVNLCTNEAQVVSATNKDAAKAAWPYCDNDCTDCIPPAIQVGCDNGTCAGVVVPFPDASADLLTDHCGVDPPVGATPGKLHFTCGGG